MSNQEILERAIQKAIEGGWGAYNPSDRTWAVEDIEHWFQFGKYASSQSKDHNYLLFLFSHDFAKALWGEKKILKEEVMPGKGVRTWYSQQYDWKQHLQQMVIAEDPIKYLGDNI
jgi:hypothetical protein